MTVTTAATNITVAAATVAAAAAAITAAAAKLLQSCPTLCDPTDSSPPGSPVPRICSDKFRGIWGGGFGHIHLGYIRFSQKLVGVLG